ncbi:cob(I)yrinic acid a,c-diamide adenosyltransferase [Paenibacillus physcomitrellae]|uniref:Corrinoid adenosyltransferase n=1 Tax=Paenibacillus physcomitrellae TaxID=1619311 RepID=A0ABQ1G7K0_9BACL|nr:cob(I)yrinic acid a,c-diamide adenosyltransferase [Paenibacillus physcomitrellae]GGA38272.1 ATP--cob(I)alamin adenosyltransferase [Paenibacillus physcomitrellae]
MKIYTRTGDQGNTFVIGGQVRKDDLQVEAYGSLDELNSFVGQAAAAACADGESWNDELKKQLVRIQHELFDCGSDLAYAKPNELGYKVHGELTGNLEAWIDSWEQELPPLERFVLPGGTTLAAVLHVCRTVCRRAERRVVSLAAETDINKEVLRYVNRLSDYFFTAARLANVKAGVPETEYERSGKVFR